MFGKKKVIEDNNTLKKIRLIYFEHEGQYWAASGSQLCRNISIESSLESKRGILTYELSREEFEQNDRTQDDEFYEQYINKDIKLETYAEYKVWRKNYEKVDRRWLIKWSIISYGTYFIVGEEKINLIFDFQVRNNVWLIISYLTMILLALSVFLSYKSKLNKKEMELKRKYRNTKRFNFDLAFQPRLYFRGITILLIIIPLIVTMTNKNETNSLLIGVFGGGVPVLIYYVMSSKWFTLTINRILPFDQNNEFVKSSKIRKNIAALIGFIVTIIIMFPIITRIIF